MNMLEKLKAQGQQTYPLLDQAFNAINNDELSFAEKVAQVQTLEDLASGQEAELFGDAYSALYSVAKTDADFILLSGEQE